MQLGGNNKFPENVDIANMEQVYKHGMA